MKTVINTIALLLMMSLATDLGAQTTATWIGGTPGRSNEWTCASNWKESRTPDEFSLVVIPADKMFYPVIKGEVDAIDALLLESGAVMTLADNASLTILGETGRMGGMILLGTIQNEGIIDLGFETGNMITIQQIKGNGIVAGITDQQLVSIGQRNME